MGDPVFLNLILSAYARSRTVIMLCKRFELFTRDGTVKHSQYRFAVTAKFNGVQWTFSSDGQKPIAITRDMAARIFADVEECVILNATLSLTRNNSNIASMMQSRNPAIKLLLGNAIAKKPALAHIFEIFAHPERNIPVIISLCRGQTLN